MIPDVTFKGIFNIFTTPLPSNAKKALVLFFLSTLILIIIFKNFYLILIISFKINT
jgi:hypothetical protein